MSTNTSLIINSMDSSDKKIHDTINYVNPDISNGVAIELAQRINSLTNNSYQSTTRVNKEELDGSKPAPAYSYFQVGGTNRDIVDGVVNCSLTPSQLTSNNFKIVVRGGVVYRMNRLPEWSSDSSDMTAFDVLTHAATGAANRLTCSITLKDTPQVGQTYSGVFLIPESDIYNEMSVTINITVAEEE